MSSYNDISLTSKKNIWKAVYVLWVKTILSDIFTLSLNSISALYPVFSQFMVTTPPNSIVSVPIKMPTDTFV